MSFSIDFHYKILMLGESQVGKTSLLLKYTDDVFKINMLPTFGLDVRYKYLQKDNNNIRLDLWDTAGQEKFRTMTQNYYKGSDGIILVYDISNESSFETLKNWMDDIKENSKNKIEVIIIGNKLDLERQVEKKRLEQFAEEYKVPYFETSAKTGEGVEESFNKLIDNLSKKEKKINESIDEEDDKNRNSLTLKNPNNNDNNNGMRKECIC